MKIITRFVLVLFSLNAGLVFADVKPARPSEWAKAIEQRGVPNLHQVSDTLYRSATFRRRHEKSKGDGNRDHRQPALFPFRS